MLGWDFYSPCQNSVFSTAYLVYQVKQLLQLLSMISYFFGLTINRNINMNVRDPVVATLPTSLGFPVNVLLGWGGEDMGEAITVLENGWVPSGCWALYV